MVMLVAMVIQWSGPQPYNGHACGHGHGGGHGHTMVLDSAVLWPWLLSLSRPYNGPPCGHGRTMIMVVGLTVAV